MHLPQHLCEYHHRVVGEISVVRAGGVAYGVSKIRAGLLRRGTPERRLYQRAATVMATLTVDQDDDDAAEILHRLYDGLDTFQGQKVRRQGVRWTRRLANRQRRLLTFIQLSSKRHRLAPTRTANKGP